MKSTGIMVASGALLVAAQAPTPTAFEPYLGVSDKECYSAVQSVVAQITDMPLPGDDIQDYAKSYDLGQLRNTDDPCELPAVTGTAANAFSEWASSYTEWQKDHISEYRDVWSACSHIPKVSDMLPVGSTDCSSLAAQITGSSDPRDDDDDEEHDDDKDDDDDDDENNISVGWKSGRKSRRKVGGGGGGGMSVGKGIKSIASTQGSPILGAVFIAGLVIGILS
ncbi:hypothetical protein FALBO_6062 [Fusarium albosuccineum]|uniref:Infection structure specific protein n=1 Tax=Fusarium albosuccineum TaxID=1237068 RepID=A0A8H4PEY9_9HYPO|nr:hypothetical protein FALBO_6062 [Fusarium albosuccineum]